MASVKPAILFTDLDGTCVHYDWHEFGTVAEAATPAGLYPCTSLDGSQHALLLRLPPSTSGAQGVISLESLRLYAALRQLGVKIVVITGARMATLLARLPFIPAADAYVCESGGRIFYPAAACGNVQAVPTAAPLVEDLEWRQSHAAVAGPHGQDGVPPEHRAGSLWRFYADLQASMPEVQADATSYTTAFRLKGPDNAVAAALQRMPAEGGLATAVNLGAADVFPASSGKENAAQHLMAHFGATAAECAFVCDDDNDMALAHMVGRAYLPGITAESVRLAVQLSPQRFYVAAARGVFGAEECLRLLLREALVAGADQNMTPMQ